MIDSALAALASLADPSLLLMLVVGVVAGLVIGLVPGLGGTGAVAILLPVTFGMEAPQALALLIGALAVVHTSDTVAAVLLGAPGSASASVTMLDGYAMARRARPPGRCRCRSCRRWPAASSARSGSRWRSHWPGRSCCPSAALSCSCSPSSASHWPRACRGATSQGTGGGPARPAARHGRHLADHRRVTLHLREPVPRRRAVARRGRARRVRPRRDRLARRAAPAPARLGGHPPGQLPRGGPRVADALDARAARLAHRHLGRDPARCRRHRRHLARLRPGVATAKDKRSSARATPAASSARRARTIRSRPVT